MLEAPMETTVGGSPARVMWAMEPERVRGAQDELLFCLAGGVSAGLLAYLQPFVGGFAPTS